MIASENKTLNQSASIDLHCRSSLFSILQYVEADLNEKSYSVGCPRLWRITKNSLHNEGIYKWVNLAPIFFWYELLPTTSGPQKFAKISVFKVENFVLSILLVPKLRSVAQIEWKKHPYLFFSTFGSKINEFGQKSEKNEKIPKS